MYIVLEHQVRYEELFWASFSQCLQACPSDIELLGSMVVETDRVQWMWKAQSIARLRHFLDPALSSAGSAWYAEVDPFEAIGT